jgi:acyl-CoA thioester hydrolase
LTGIKRPSPQERNWVEGVEMRYHETPLQVRFYEVDSYGMVWHGNYIGWFEVGRNELTEQFGIGPLDLKEMGFLAPVVDLACHFKLPAKFNDSLVIRTTMERTEVAKLIFRYQIFSQKIEKVLATGSTTHVLIDFKGNLIYQVPTEVLKKIEAIQKYLEV